MPLACTRQQSQSRRPRRRNPGEGKEAKEPERKMRHAKQDQTAGPGVEAGGNPKVQESSSEGDADRKWEARGAEQVGGGDHSRRRSEPTAKQTEGLVATEGETEADTYTVQKEEERSYIQVGECH
jgi:hypothetical protein